MKKPGKRFTLASAVIAFLLWGGWALYINHEPGSMSGLISGLTQGIASFTITLFMVKTVTYLFNHISNKRLQLILPSVITLCITGSLLTSIHLLVNTPSILRTISPALSVAFIFCLVTTFKLREQSK